MNSVYSVRKCPRYKFIVLSHLSRLVHDYSNIMKIIFTVAFSWSIVAFSAIMLLLRIMVKCFESNQRSYRIFLITFLLIFFCDRAPAIYWRHCIFLSKFLDYQLAFLKFASSANDWVSHTVKSVMLMISSIGTYSPERLNIC